MTKKIFLRFVLTVLIVTVILSLPTLAAEIQGGMGKIEGVDGTYKAAVATINAAGNGMSVDTANAITLTEDNNKDLCGIYFVSNDNFATKTIVYVYGSYAKRKDLPNAKETGHAIIKNTTDWVPGTLTGTNVISLTYNWPTNYYISSHNNVSASYVTAIENASTVTAKTKALDDIANYIKTKVYWNYAYDPDEIVPVSELNYVGFRLWIRQGTRYVLPADAKSEVSLFVMAPDGTVSSYQAYVIPDYAGWGKQMTVPASSFNNLPTEGYIVGIKLRPFGAFDAQKATINTAEANNNICYGMAMLPSYYSINAPRAPKPSGLEVGEDGKVTGLKSGTEYEYVNLNNTKRLKEFAETGYAITELSYSPLDENTVLSAGLWAIRVAESGDSPASESVVLYVQGGSISDILHIDPQTGRVVDDGSIYANVGWSGANKERDVRHFNQGMWSGALYPQTTYMDKNPLTLFNTGDNNLVNWSAGSYYDGSYTRQDAVHALESEYATYQYFDSEIIPFSMFKSYTFRTTFFKTQYLAEGVVNTKVIFYVINEKGELESRVWLNPMDFAGTTTHTVEIEDFDDTTGFIVGIEIHPTGNIPDTTKLATKDNAGADRTAYCITLMEGGYKINLPRVMEGKPELTVNDTLVTGFKPEYTYEYANLNDASALAGYAATGVVMSEPEYTKLEKGIESFEFEAGIYAIRVAGEKGVTASSDMAVVYVRGDGNDILHTNEKNFPITEKYNADREALRSFTPLFKKGVWRGTLPVTRSQLTGSETLAFANDGYLTSVCFAAENYYKGTLDYEGFVKVVESDHMTYQFLDEEIIPFEDFISYSYKTKVRQGSVKMEKGQINTLFNIYTIQEDGSIKVYSATEKMDFVGGSLTVHKFEREDFGDATGYIVAIEIRPTGHVTEGTVLYAPESNRIPDAYDIHLIANGYVARSIAPTPELFSFPVIEGGHGKISGLKSHLTHEVRWSTDEGKTFTEWKKIPEGSTSFEVTESGTYQIRVMEDDNFVTSRIATINVVTADYVETVNNGVRKAYLTEDFVEAKVEYEMDVTVKNWISSLLLNNIKAIAPDATVKVVGDGFSYKFNANNISTSPSVHYYDMSIAFDGDSKQDISYDKFKAASGELYVKNVHFESTTGLPFAKAELNVYVGSEYNGMELDSASYNERIDRLRYLEIVQVTDGWVTLTQFGEPIVLLIYED